jgi:hypothetical protein
MEHAIVEERVRIASGRLTLSGILSYPGEASPLCGVLLCAPHPNFAGNMENNVVEALARHLAPGAVVLRFNYRGVGDSEILLPPGVSVYDYWNEAEETRNYADAIGDVRAALHTLSQAAAGLPLMTVGYSFGAIVGLKHGASDSNISAIAGIAPPLTRCDFEFLSACRKRCLLISGSDDFVFSAETSTKLNAACGSNVRQELLKGNDHFFRGDEGTVCEKIGAFIQDALPSA